MDVWTSITYRDFDKVDKAIRLMGLTHRQRNSFSGACATTRESEVLMIRQEALFDANCQNAGDWRLVAKALLQSVAPLTRRWFKQSARQTGETRFHRSATMRQ